MTILTLEQRTPEWLAARLGRVNSSDAADLLATIKSGEAAARRDLRLRLVCERLTGRVPDAGFVSADMARGVELEPLARAAYEAETGAFVSEIGYVQHDDLLAGYSPDGFVGDDGLIEIKVPKTATHIRYLREGRIPTDYVPQCRHALWITGRSWLDFVSFDDRLPEDLQFFRVRMTHDEAKTDDYERTLRAFLSEVQHELDAIQTLGNLRKQMIASLGATA